MQIRDGRERKNTPRMALNNGAEMVVLVFLKEAGGRINKIKGIKEERDRDGKEPWTWMLVLTF